MAKRLPPQHAEKRAEALRANLMKRKAQTREREEIPLPMEKAPAKDKPQ